MIRQSKKHRFLIIISILFGSLFLFMGGCYVVLRRATFAGDKVMYGKRISTLAHEIRQELLQQVNFEPVTFMTKDNLKIAGALIKHPQAQSNVLLCHGYRGGKEFMYGYLDMFPRSNILLFDFRAHGQSEGRMTSIGVLEYKDVIAAARFFKETTRSNQQKPLPLIILGLSMGGAALLKAAEVEPDLCDCIVVDSVFRSLHAAVAKVFGATTGLPNYPFFSIMSRMFNYCAGCDLASLNPVDCVKKITKPIFFIHSCNDSFIPPKHCVQLYANAEHKGSKIWIGPKCQHGWLHTYYPEVYKTKITKFLSKNVPNYIG